MPPHFVQGKVKHYVFVGSAGAYAANSVEPMHVEGDKRKSSAGGCPAPCALLGECCELNAATGYPSWLLRVGIYIVSHMTCH